MDAALFFNVIVNCCLSYEIVAVDRFRAKSTINSLVSFLGKLMRIGPDGVSIVK